MATWTCHKYNVKGVMNFLLKGDHINKLAFYTIC